MLARIEEARNDPETHKKSNLNSFFQHTEAFVRHARDLARSGKKDTARNWYRYLQNARVVEVIHTSNFVKPSSVEKLRQEIMNLGIECHPLDAPNWETDIQVIRSELEKIVVMLTSKLTRRKRKSAVPLQDKISRVESAPGVWRS